MYMQVLNFTNVAKTENAELGKSIPIWVGKSTGKTLAEALGKIKETSQKSVYWGHVKVIVLTEDVLKRPINEVIEAITGTAKFGTTLTSSVRKRS
ncbi:Ger(x)C family spore germination protein [Cohnella faecalis]|uniref:Spore germination protein N-terminal domain-containing protein n=1 Tax=Cohnella faecalis TaxID=2315694 RepID=A0A398CPK7_9BACL|nr:hypothetical protein [Cohnella faecalis]RIE05336.1 hypothetical protein D3H35_00655 [Cohnella faecalis]